jgi:chromosome segregation ATPase
MNNTPSVETESDLQSELDRLTSRLAQGQRDHERSHDDLRKLEGEIRQVESELDKLNREHTTLVT